MTVNFQLPCFRHPYEVMDRKGNDIGQGELPQ